MGTEFLCLLYLGFCLSYGEERKDEKLPKPSLSALPSSVIQHESNVTLQCQAHFQNVTFMLGKLHDSGYQQEHSSAGNEAEFSLTDLQPEDAGDYFCAYKTAASLKWSERSQYLQLVIMGSLPKPSLSTSTDSAMTPGHRTLQCLIPYNETKCVVIALLKMGIAEPLQPEKVGRNQTDFVLWNVTSKDNGNYSCIYYQCTWPYLGSTPSRSLKIWVTDEHIEPEAPSPKTEQSHHPQ
uniref:V-set and transmembrane domain-containing protein 1 n=1 Tax=Castor canadensis TaxID=51338 RepID=A0A8B7VEG3_CASCN|nr:V-set and transmembrane domain-containing protein 1 [Castor canadensis]XP_020029843.1 V-set and transmembrane domain-containing protein 1 [Castor canadensis]